MSVARQQSNEVRYCWEQVLRTNPLFRISQVFAASIQASRLLPLYALFAAIEETCSIGSDEIVALRKLHWWREEWRRFVERGSDHPILKELLRQGLQGDLVPEPMEAIFSAAESRIDMQPSSGPEELSRFCAAIGRPLLQLESVVTGGGAEGGFAVEAYAESNGLAQLLRENQHLPAERAWRWLPLKPFRSRRDRRWRR